MKLRTKSHQKLTAHSPWICPASANYSSRRSLRVISPAVAIHMICCVSRAKMWNYDARDGRRRTLTSFFLIFDIFIIFHIFHYFLLFWCIFSDSPSNFLPGDGLRSLGYEKYWKITFFIYMSFWCLVCRPCLIESASALPQLELPFWSNCSFIHLLSCNGS